MYTKSLLTERLALVGVIKSQAVTADATASSDVIDMRYFGRVIAVIPFGDYAAGNDGAVTALFNGDTASGGSFATAITGKSLTAATFTGSAGDGAPAIIEVSADEVLAQGLRYLRLDITPTNQNMQVAAVVLAGDLRYEPGTEWDVSSVAEILT